MDVEPLVSLRTRVTEEIGKVVVGQREAIDLMLVALMADGHILLEGVPGVAKTLLARSFAACLSLKFSRVQFTPDLMPGDVIGANIFNFQTNAFVLTHGPIFTQLLLADEINRTPPKTQAALLEAMQERSVTIDGRGHGLGPPFMVIATQNPIEQQGTYPLPEAQLDRFLFKHTLDYPSREDELAVVARHGSGAAMADPRNLGVSPVIDTAGLQTLGALVDGVRLNDDIVAYVVDLVRATRQQPTLQFGASPRAAAMLASSARALAAFEGRDFVIPDDVKRLARPALRHRLVLSPSAEIEGQNVDGVLGQIIERQAAPR
ncbi:MAG: MoxR family ATPase [Alphaproteobacteria bacterium]|nr:MoxR family ATPase [Alphaproteobacteria bacterium]MCW5743284.1 MoxR family ATPase [Alphaproteobacteria bacterium]